MTTRLKVPVPAGTYVRCYRNLRPGTPTWSVQVRARNGNGNAHSWYVAGHADDLTLGGATFRVYEKGRQRVLATGRKNVHAFVLGTLLGFGDQPAPWLVEPCTKIAYNPRRDDCFHDVEAAGIPIVSADAAYLTSTGQVLAVGASE